LKATQKSIKSRQSINQAKFPPSSLVQLLEPGEWESFIEDCCRNEMDTGKKYVFVQKIGGAGDAGRDIEARYQVDLVDNEWDLYQAKRYQTAVGESSLYPELAKFFHHIKEKTYPPPRHYYICAPKNTTPTLHDLIANPKELRQKFLKAWHEGKMNIAVSKFPLDIETENIVKAFDFSKIRECPVKDLIESHAKDRVKHGKLFGIEAPRGENDPTPALPSSIEQTYLAEILKVYSEHSNTPLTIDQAFQSPDYGDHLQSCRTEFYSADGLARFSRDIYPGEFENLKDAVHNGVKRLVASPQLSTGMERMTSVLNHASGLQITENPLSKRLLPADLPGTCHHLVNEKKIKWVK
jgi:hypothetical protein